MRTNCPPARRPPETPFRWAAAPSRVLMSGSSWRRKHSSKVQELVDDAVPRAQPSSAEAPALSSWLLRCSHCLVRRAPQSELMSLGIFGPVGSVDPLRHRRGSHAGGQEHAMGSGGPSRHAGRGTAASEWACLYLEASNGHYRNAVTAKPLPQTRRVGPSFRATPRSYPCPMNTRA